MGSLRAAMLLLGGMAALCTPARADEWRRVGPAAPGATLPSLVIGLRHADPGALAARLRQVSEPGSEQYGRYLTIEQVAALAQPAPGAAEAVTAWLREHGLEPRQSRSGDYLRLDGPVPIAAVARALGAEFFEYERAGSGRRVHRAPAGAALPPHLLAHVDGIFPLRVLPPARRRRRSRAARAEGPSAGAGAWPHDCSGLSTAGMITPAVIRSRYNVTQQLDTRGKTTKGSMASALPYDDSDGCGFLQSDVDERDQLCGLGSAHSPVRPKGDAARKFNKPPCNCSDYDNCGESILDVQTLSGVAPGVSQAYWLFESGNPTDLLTQINEDENAELVFSLSFGDSERESFKESASRLATAPRPGCVS